MGNSAVTHGQMSMCFEDRLYESDLDFNEFCLDIETTLNFSSANGKAIGDFYAILNPFVSGNKDSLELRISNHVAQTVTGRCSVLNESGEVILSENHRTIYSSVSSGFIGGSDTFVNSESIEVLPNSVVLKCTGFGGTGFNVNDGLSIVLSKTISLFNKTKNYEINHNSLINGASSLLVMQSGVGATKENENFFEAFIGSDNDKVINGKRIGDCALTSANFEADNCKEKIQAFFRDELDDNYLQERQNVVKPDLHFFPRFSVSKLSSIEGGSYKFEGKRMSLKDGDLLDFWQEDFNGAAYTQIRTERNDRCIFIDCATLGLSESGAANLDILSSWHYFGAGGVGAFDAIAIHPNDPEILFAGADVGGIFFSKDGGQSWKNISHSLTNFEILDIKIRYDSVQNETIIMLGTVGGIFKSTVTGNNYTSISFTKINMPVENTDYNNDGTLDTNGFNLPIQSLDFHETTWFAGVGRAGQSIVVREEEFQYYPEHVLKSTDDGESWSPVLTLKNLEGIQPGPEADYERAQVTDISLMYIPNESQIHIYAATTRGLFHSNNSGQDWYELGLSTIRQTTDNGLTWVVSCEAGSSSSCPPGYSVSNTDTLGISHNGILPKSIFKYKYPPSSPSEHFNNPLWKGVDPFVEYSYQTPNLRSVRIKPTDYGYDVYINVVDYGFDSRGSGCSGPSGKPSGKKEFSDINNEYTRGGLYRMRSTHKNNFTNLIGGGALKRDTGLDIPKFLCNKPTEHSDLKFKSTHFTNLSVNPQETGHLIDVFVGARGLFGGIYGYSSGTNKWYFLGGHKTNGNCPNFNCWTNENGFPNAYFDKSNPIHDLAVNWTSEKVYATSIRGVLKGAITGPYTENGPSPNIEYDDLAVKNYTKINGKRRFESTHLDDTVVLGGISFIKDSVTGTNYTFQSAADTGVFRTSAANLFNQEKLWENTFDLAFQSNLKISDNKNATRSTKVVFGRINNQTILYTSAEVNSGEISIISSSDYGHSYQVIGGRGFSAFKPYNNGFTAFARGGSENKSHHKDLGVNNIAVVLENTLGHNLNYNSLYAATDSGGFYFDPSAPANNQWEKLEFCIPTSTQCRKEGIVGSVIRSGIQNIFYLSFDHVNDVYDGIYLLDRNLDPLKANQLQNTANNKDLHGPYGDKDKNASDYMKNPNLLAISEDSSGNRYLLRSIDSEIGPMIFRTNIDSTNGTINTNWDLVFSLAEDAIIRGDADKDPRVPDDHLSELGYEVSEYFRMLREKRISSIEVHPKQPEYVMIGITASPFFETYQNKHIFLSNNGGEFFGINSVFESGLPSKNISAIDIDGDRDRIYISTTGASTFYFKDTITPFKNVETINDD